jgi:hypothetical protein
MDNLNNQDQTTIWYGAKDNAVQFATNPASLHSAGIDTTHSFTVNGTIEGLELGDSGNVPVGTNNGGGNNTGNNASDEAQTNVPQSQTSQAS